MVMELCECMNSGAITAEGEIMAGFEADKDFVTSFSITLSGLIAYFARIISWLKLRSEVRARSESSNWDVERVDRQVSLRSPLVQKVRWI